MMKLRFSIALLFMLVAHSYGDREIFTSGFADGKQMSWSVTDQQTAALSRWNPYAALPPKPIPSILRSAHEYADTHFRGQKWRLAGLTLQPVLATSDGKWAYIVRFAAESKNVSGVTVVVLQDGTLIEPQPKQP